MAIIDMIQANPRTAVIVISLLVTVFITTVRYYLTDRDKMKEIKDRQKELRKEMKEFKHDPAKMMELNQKMLEDFPEQMKQSFKPMVITMIPILLIFGWMRGVFALTAIASTWLWWYIGASIISSIILSKAVGLQ
tara:strand:- start:84 stop:488 length:405 start_codon:yes stop_codon:yes gene_type:complete